MAWSSNRNPKQSSSGVMPDSGMPDFIDPGFPPLMSEGPLQFKLGFLAPWNNSFEGISALTSASAISMAITQIQADPTMNQRFNFR